MTKDETVKIVLKLHGAYFSQDKIFNSSELDSRINIWDVYFKDFTFNVVNQAVDEWISNNRTMPQIAELLPRCKDLRDLESYPKDDPMNWKSPAEQTWDAEHGELKDEDVPQWIKDLTDEFVKWLRADPKMKAKFREEEKKKNGGSDCLPYEI